MTDIDDMDMKALKAEIEGMGYRLHLLNTPVFECVQWKLISIDDGRLQISYYHDFDTDLDAARAALRWLREREDK